MPRIRTVKPEFWAHEELSEFPPETHMLAAALLNYADDEGYFNANPKLVKAICCPLRDDSMSVHESLKQLANIGYIKLGTGEDGKSYGVIEKFQQHQVISRPTASKISVLCITWDDSLKTHGVIMDDSLPERKGKEQGKEGEQGKERSPAGKLPCLASEAIDYLNSVIGSKFQKKGKSLSHANARLEEGHSLDDLKAVINAKWLEWGKDPKMAQYLRPETLFGASKFDGYLIAAKASGGGTRHTGFDSREYTDHIPDWEEDNNE